MKTYVGKTVYPGIAIRKIQMLKKGNKNVYRKHIDDVDQELARMERRRS